MACCTTTRPDDGNIDQAAVDRAMQGQPVALSAREKKWLMWRLATERGMGLDLIARHVGVGRTQVATLLASARRA